MHLEISCPYHAETEVLDLPDGYKNFEGQVACNTRGRNNSVLLVEIKIVDGVLVSVKRRGD